jgi:hypothetical protein
VPHPFCDANFEHSDRTIPGSVSVPCLSRRPILCTIAKSNRSSITDVRCCRRKVYRTVPAFCLPVLPRPTPGCLPHPLFHHPSGVDNARCHDMTCAELQLLPLPLLPGPRDKQHPTPASVRSIAFCMPCCDCAPSVCLNIHSYAFMDSALAAPSRNRNVSGIRQRVHPGNHHRRRVCARCIRGGFKQN